LHSPGQPDNASDTVVGAGESNNRATIDCSRGDRRGAVHRAHGRPCRRTHHLRRRPLPGPDGTRTRKTCITMPTPPQDLRAAAPSTSTGPPPGSLPPDAAAARPLRKPRPTTPAALPTARGAVV